MDLNYFIFTSPSKNIRLSKINEFLEIYHKSFLDAAERLGARIHQSFTLADIKNEFSRRLFFGFIALLIVYPITVTESKDAMDVNEFFAEDNSDAKRQVYRIPAFIEMFKMALPYFIENGALWKINRELNQKF